MSRVYRYLLAFKGCFFWADVRTFASMNRSRFGKKTEVMMLVPLGRWRGVGIVRVTKDAREEEG